MLSWRPAHAARRSDFEPIGIRSSSAPTRRRKARICCRVTLSRGSTKPAMSSRSLGQSWLACASVQECHMKTGSGADQCPALHVDARSNLSRNSCSLGGREKPSQSRRTLRVTMTFIEPSLRVAGERASSRNRRADGVLSSFCLRQRSGDRLLTPNRWCEPPREERMRRKRLLRDPLVERFEDSLSRRPRWPLLDALALPPEIVDGTFGRDPLHDPR